MAISYEHSVEVACPRDVAFALLDDLPRTPEWLGPCTKLEKLTAGPNRVGDELNYEYKQGSQAGRMAGKILERVQDQRLVCRYTDKMMQVDVDFKVESAMSGSRLTHVITITPQTLMMKLMSPLIRLGLPKQTKDAMARLKQILEEN